MEDDHAHAAVLAAGLEDLGYQCVQPDTNIVLAHWNAEEPDAGAPWTQVMAHVLRAGKVKLHAGHDASCRLVTHLNVDKHGVFMALDEIKLAMRLAKRESG